MSDKDKELEITNRDRYINLIKAGLKLLPAGIGEALIQLHFGKGEEARQRRLEATIEEVISKLDERNFKSEAANNEDFSDFFLKIAQPIARASHEDKRQRLRDLLFNSMLIPPGDPGWEESMYCLELLQKIDPSGLFILAMIVRAERDNSQLALTRLSGAPQWLLVPKGEMTKPIIHVGETGKYEPLKYNDVIIDKWLLALETDLKLILRQNVLVYFPHTATGLNFYSLTSAGQFLVKWTVADF